MTNLQVKKSNFKSFFKLKRLYSAVTFVAVLFASIAVFAQSPQIFNTSGTWTCPVGTTFVQVECYGAGGAGGAGIGTTGRVGGGGGSGSYVKKIIAVTPGLTYNVTVGTGGQLDDAITNQRGYGLPGGKSGFSGNAITPVTASGGTGGSVGNPQNGGRGVGGVLGGVYGITFPGTIAPLGGGSTAITVDNSNTTGTGLAVQGGTGGNSLSIVNQGSGYGTVAPTLNAVGATTQPTFTLFINPSVNSVASFQEDVILPGNDGGIGVSGASGASAVGATAPGPVGGAGGASVSFVADGSSTPNPGVAPGGGGAGGFTGSTGGSKYGAVGADGRVILTFPLATPTTLPVSLTNYTALLVNNQAKLSWETASESNNNRFEISRSTDNQTYITIASVKGNGNTSKKSKYLAYDATPANGVNYYKLVQIDNDGTTKELAIKALNFSLNKTSNLLVYPNPASGTVNVQVFNKNALTTAVLALVNTSGQTLLTKSVKLNSGVNTFKVDISNNVAPGQYILHLQSAEINESYKVNIK